MSGIGTNSAIIAQLSTRSLNLTFQDHSSLNIHVIVLTDSPLNLLPAATILPYALILLFTVILGVVV